jgi:uncharacterized protein
MMQFSPSQPRPVGMGLRHLHYAPVFAQRPAIDFVEVHAENFFACGGAIPQVLQQAAQLYPLSLHGVGLSLGSMCGVDSWHLAQLKRLVDRFNPALISDHLCFGRALLTSHSHHSQYSSLPVHANDLLPLRHTRAALAALVNNIDHVQNTLKRRIAVENVSRYMQFDHITHDYSETDFLNTLTQRTGCGVLLDINNVYVNAFNDIDIDVDRADTANIEAINAQCRRYITAITPASVMEIHLAGCTLPLQGLMIDDHAMPVNASVWKLYAYALQHLSDSSSSSSPRIVPTLIEWDLNLPPLDILLAEVAHAQQIIHRLQP